MVLSTSQLQCIMRILFKYASHTLHARWVSFFDSCEGDMMSLIELQTMASFLWHEHGFIEFYWKFLGLALGFDFKVIKNESDVMKMCMNVPVNM